MIYQNPTVRCTGLVLILLSFCLSGCNDQAENYPDAVMDMENILSIDGGCDYYSVPQKSGENWRVMSSPDWVTPVATSGKAADDMRVYVESNSGESRTGCIEILYDNGVTRSIEVRQDNTQPTFSIQRTYAAGWSFDVRTYADFRGLRNQIINTQKLRDYDDDGYRIEKDNVSHIDYYYGESGSDISDDMNGKLGIDGKFNSFNLDLQASFGKSALNNSKRIFSKIRACYPERVVYLNQFDPLDFVEEDLLTVDFSAARKKVIESNGSDETIRELLDLYGTHFVIQATLGGYYDYFFSSVVENMNDLLNVEAAIKLGFAEKFKLEGDAKYKDDLEKLNNERIEKFTVKGGDAITLSMAVENGTINQTTTDKWLTSLIEEEKYELLTFQLLPLSVLFPEDITKKINNYTDRMYYREIPVTRAKSK